MPLPCSYASGRTLDAFSSWITQKLDSDTTFARVESLDSLVRDYLGAGKSSLDIKLAAPNANTDQLPGRLPFHSKLCVGKTSQIALTAVPF